MFSRSTVIVALLAAVVTWSVGWAVEPGVPTTFIREADVGPYDWYESNFGGTVDIDGDTVVGGDGYEAVEIYRRTADGEWTAEGRYGAPDATFEWCCDFDFCWACDPDGAVDGFGSAVAVSGDRVLVGAPGNDVRGNDAGAAYVFARRTNGTWRLEQRLDPPESRPSDGFGATVGIEGKRILVGAPGTDGGAGAVYEFTRRSGAWVAATSFGASGSKGFGSELALDGEQVLVTTNRGAHVFERRTGVWIEVAQLDVEAKHCWRTNCLALNGNLAAVTEEGTDAAVAAFGRTSGTWRRTQTLTSPRPDGSGEFGRAIAIAGHVMVLGDRNGGENGFAHAYDLVDDRWVYRETLEEAGRANYPVGFGSAIALDEGRLAVGAPSDHYGDGVVYIFVDTPTLFEVGLDVLPWRTPNRIDPTSTVLFPVAVHGAHDFDALQTELASLRLMPGNAPARNFRVMDVNRDGMPDLVPYFRARDLDIPCGESAVELTGETHHGLEFHGADTVMNARCR